MTGQMQDIMARLRAVDVAAWTSWGKTALHRWRHPLTIGAVVVLVGGMAVSIWALDLEWADIGWGALLLNLLLLSPLRLAVAALNLQLLARSVGRRIPYVEAFTISAIGRVAEVLPGPGGALVRGGALMRAGARVGESAAITLLTGFLTLTISLGLSGAAITLAGFDAGLAILTAGGLGVLLCAALIARRAGKLLTAGILAQRFALLGLGVLRLMTAFAIIGVGINGVEAAIFIICTTLSSAVTVVPAGIGIAETAAASLAYFVDISPAAAFLAVAINGVLGLVFCSSVALLAMARNAGSRPEQGDQKE